MSVKSHRQSVNDDGHFEGQNRLHTHSVKVSVKKIKASGYKNGYIDGTCKGSQTLKLHHNIGRNRQVTVIEKDNKLYCILYIL